MTPNAPRRKINAHWSSLVVATDQWDPKRQAARSRSRGHREPPGRDVNFIANWVINGKPAQAGIRDLDR
jgi:hypothetical protein